VAKITQNTVTELLLSTITKAIESYRERNAIT